MKSTLLKKKSSKRGLLYAILDKEVIEKYRKNVYRLAESLSKNGVDIFQLRAKGTSDKELIEIAGKLSRIIHKYNKKLIINDRADIAYLTGADGVHLGASDLPAKSARKILGRKSIIGKTVHSLAELTRFQKEAIDYVSIGPVFATETKPQLSALDENQLKILIKRSTKLLFAIGGINLYNIDSLLKLGIKNFAICRGLITADNLRSVIKKYNLCLKKVS